MEGERCGSIHVLAQQLAEERMKDVMREAEQARLIRAAKGPRKVQEWRLPVTLILIGQLI